MQEIAPVSGWALNSIVELDGHVDGVCRAFLKAGAERRQVVAALLSACPPVTDPLTAVKLGTMVKSSTHREMLQAAFGDVPDGMRGALARSGVQPHGRRFYQRLFALLLPGGKRAKVIKQLHVIDAERIRILEALPLELCVPNVVSRVRSVRAATDIASLFELLTQQGVNQRALAESVARVGAASDLSELWERWAMKCAFPDHPVPGSATYVPITCGAGLRRMAIRYRNCARRFLSQVLDGQSAFAEFHHRSESAVVHLCSHNGAWVLDNLFGRENAGVSMGLRRAAVAYLSRSGVSESYGQLNGRGRWSVLRRLTRSSLLLDVEFD